MPVRIRCALRLQLVIAVASEIGLAYATEARTRDVRANEADQTTD